MAVSLNITIEDAKGAKSTTSFNMSDALSTTSYAEIAVQVVTLIKPLITGRIINVQFCVGVDVSGVAGINDAPDIASDVEEGARFIWNSVGGFTASNRLPTFNEDYIVPFSRLVDLLDDDVIQFLGAITGPLTTTDDGPQSMTDYRGADILSLDSARESFQRSRRVRGG